MMDNNKMIKLVKGAPSDFARATHFDGLASCYLRVEHPAVYHYSDSWRVSQMSIKQLVHSDFIIKLDYSVIEANADDKQCFAVYKKYGGNNVKKDGHLMFIEDVVKDLNRKSYLESEAAKLTVSAVGKLDDKPVYTQAMKKNKELPPIGSECEYHSNSSLSLSDAVDKWESGDKLECIAHTTSFLGNPIAVFRHSGGLSISLKESTYNPVDTRTEQEKLIDKFALKLKLLFYRNDDDETFTFEAVELMKEFSISESK